MFSYVYKFKKIKVWIFIGFPTLITIAIKIIKIIIYEF